MSSPSKGVPYSYFSVTPHTSSFALSLICSSLGRGKGAEPPPPQFQIFAVNFEPPPKKEFSLPYPPKNAKSRNPGYTSASSCSLCHPSHSMVLPGHTARIGQPCWWRVQGQRASDLSLRAKPHHGRLHQAQERVPEPQLCLQGHCLGQFLVALAVLNDIADFFSW